MKKVLFVADFFADEYPGGAELTTEALFKSASDEDFIVNKIKCRNLNKKHILEMLDFHWIIFNFATLPDAMKIEIAKNIQYSIVEYDYKFCKYRSPEKHLALGGEECNCAQTETGKINLVFYGYAQKVWFMSEKQRQVFFDNVPTLKKEKTQVLGSAFEDSQIQFFKQINEKIKNQQITKNENYVIIDSKSWIKGTKQSVKKAEQMGLNYQVVGHLPYKDMLKKLLESKGLFFLPNGGDTCPRLVIEAKLLGCDLILNDNVQHKEESWFLNRETILEHLEQNKKQFWDYYRTTNTSEEYALEKAFLAKHKISFANQVYNEPEAIKNYLNSCLQFDGIVDEVFIINHRSSDNTLEVIESFEEKYKQSGIKLRWKTEPRDFSKEFTHGDLRTDAVYSCENEIVFNHDADFIFGSGFLKTMKECIMAFEREEIYAASYEIPVVSGDLVVKQGKIESYSWCNVHVHVPRVVKKSKAICLQKHVGGKYEWWYPKNSGDKWYQARHNKCSVLSIENKSKERLELRKTMNTFFEDLANNKVHGNWLDNKELRKETETWSIDGEGNKKINIVGEKYVL